MQWSGGVSDRGRSPTGFGTKRYQNHRPYPEGPRVRSTKIGPDGRIARRAMGLMSKAFVKEPDSEADLPYEPPALPAGIKNYMTPQGHRQIRDELHQLLRVERPKVVETVAWSPETAIGQRTATTSTANAASARSIGASASCRRGWRAPRWSTRSSRRSGIRSFSARCHLRRRARERKDRHNRRDRREQIEVLEIRYDGAHGEIE